MRARGFGEIFGTIRDTSFSRSRGLACDIFNRRTCIRYEKSKNPTIRADAETIVYVIKSTLSRVPLLNIIEEEYVVEKNPTGRGKTVDFMGVWNKTSQYDWTNEFYLSEYFGTSHSRSFQATRVQFFLLNRGSLMWALWWSVEYVW